MILAQDNNNNNRFSNYNSNFNNFNYNNNSKRCHRQDQIKILHPYYHLMITNQVIINRLTFVMIFSEIPIWVRSIPVWVLVQQQRVHHFRHSSMTHFLRNHVWFKNHVVQSVIMVLI